MTARLRRHKRIKGRSASAKLRLPLLLVLGVTLSAALLLIWSILAEIDRVVRANGRIVPYEMPQFVQHLEGGVVANVFVKEGDRVRRGDAIAMISDIQAESLVNERQMRIRALQAEAHRLEAEIKEQKPDWSGFSTANDIVRQQQEIFAARETTLRLAIGSLDAQLSQKLAELNEVTKRIAALESEVDIAEEQMGVVQTMVDKDAGSRLELLDAMARVAQFNSQLSDLESSLPRIGFQLEELRNRKAETEAEFKEGALLRLAEVRLELDQLRAEIAAAKDRLQRTSVTSPVDGVVNRVFTRTVGGVVRSGEPVAEITPDSAILIVEGWIDPTERATILPGLRAIVRISAYDFAVHGSLEGEVVEVSADTVESEDRLRQYRVRVKIDAQSYARFGQPVSPGMVATADVVIGKRTVFQYLTSPLIRGLETALRDRK